MGSSASDGIFPAPGMWAAEESELDRSRRAARSEDERLVARTQAGDEAALRALLDRYGRTVLNVGMRVLRDPGEAQELVQDVFLQVYRKAHLFDPGKGSFRSWLVRLASNRAFDRREYLNLHRFYDARNLDDFADAVQSTVDIEYQTQIRQGEAALRKTFAELNSKQQKTLELYFFEGYTLREISKHLNESLANTRHYYYRALEKLRETLVGHKDDQDG